MAAFRLHGTPGHLIVERWDEPGIGGSTSAYANHGNDAHEAEAQTLYHFFANCISFEHTVKRLYKRIKMEFPEWDKEDNEEDSSS